MSDVVEKLRHTVFGNGEDGLVDQMKEVRRDLYANEDRGSKGVVADVREMKGDLRIIKFIGAAAVVVIPIATSILLWLIDRTWPGG